MCSDCASSFISLVLLGGLGKQKTLSGSACGSKRPGEDPFPLHGYPPGGHAATSECVYCGFVRCGVWDICAFSFSLLCSF